MIIGIGGKKRSGKTEIANILAKRFSLPIVAFAKRLKEVVTECSGLNDSHKEKLGTYNRNVNLQIINGELKKYNYALLDQDEIDHIRAIEYHDVGQVYRLLMQYIGTQIFRKRNPNHWIEVFIKETTKDCKNGFICDDVRFSNEHYAIKTRFKNHSTVTIKVISPDADNFDGHASEVSIDKIQFDKVFNNEHQGIDILKNKLDILFKDVLVSKTKAVK